MRDLLHWNAVENLTTIDVQKLLFHLVSSSTLKNNLKQMQLGTQIFSFFHACVMLISSLFTFHYRA